MGASNAVVMRDPAGNKKIDKRNAGARIDPLVAGVMGAFAVSEGIEDIGGSLYNDTDRAVIM